MFGNTVKDLQAFYDEVNKGVKMSNACFKDSDIKAKALPPYAFVVENLGKKINTDSK